MLINQRIATIASTSALALSTLISACQTAMSAPHPADHVHSLAADRPAVHGMLLVGTKALYVSHLPMFHAPHDYQAIAEITFSDSHGDVRTRYLQDRQTSHSPLYTVVPAPGVLPTMMQPQAHFAADLYRGHFERGGVPIMEGLTATVVRVIHFRKFSPTDPPKQPQYLLFGSAQETFAAHRIGSAPDFDQVVSVRPSNPISDSQLASGPTVTLPGALPLQIGQRLSTTVAGQPNTLTVGADGYLETGDLAD